MFVSKYDIQAPSHHLIVLWYDPVMGIFLNSENVNADSFFFSSSHSSDIKANTSCMVSHCINQIIEMMCGRPEGKAFIALLIFQQLDTG